MDKLFDLQPKRIGIFRALQLGDLLCAIPAIRAIKAAYPNSELTLIGLPWSKSFVNRFSHFFSDHLFFPGFPGIPEQPFNSLDFIEFLKEANKKEFDVVFQMHGNGSLINPMIQMLGAKRTVGFFEGGRYCPNPAFYLQYPEGLPEIERHIMLVEHLGIRPVGKNTEFPISRFDLDSFEKLAFKYNLKPKKYCCVHSGARDTKRWWEPEKFARIADLLVKKGYDVVLTGTDVEAETVRRVQEKMLLPAINLVGKTDLGTLAVLIKNSRMLFSNDTGVSHVASALEVPSAIIFLASDPKRWAPLNRELHQVIMPQESANIEFVITKVEEVLRYEEVEA
jgi:ADP-heptose:LPS heptosyltransferase